MTLLIVLWSLVCIRFHVLFHSPPGVLFTFPSLYLFTIGHQQYLALPRWSWQIHTGFHVSGTTQVLLESKNISLTGLSPSLAELSNSVQLYFLISHCSPTTPLKVVWANPRSLAATSGITVLFSFPEGTKMFQFPSFALLKLCIRFRVILADRVPPFGHYRVKAFLAARRYFSQPNTSFIASRYLGILRTPLIASYKASFTLLHCVLYLSTSLILVLSYSLIIKPLSLLFSLCFPLYKSKLFFSSSLILFSNNFVFLLVLLFLLSVLFLLLILFVAVCVVLVVIRE